MCRTPYVTGTSVLGVTFKDGVLIASDTLGMPWRLCYLLCSIISHSCFTANSYGCFECMA